MVNINGYDDGFHDGYHFYIWLVVYPMFFWMYNPIEITSYN